MSITAAQRAEVAKRLNLSDQYLYQCLTNRRQMDAADARRVEQESNGLLMRWHLRQNDWHLIWPELIGAEGAPTPSKAEA